jgi:hypothetical protein
MNPQHTAALDQAMMDVWSALAAEGVDRGSEHDRKVVWATAKAIRVLADTAPKPLSYYVIQGFESYMRENL